VVDRDLVLRKLADLDAYVEELREYQGLTVAAYLADWKTQRVVERTLQIAIECCLDIASHAISDRKLRVPTTYAEMYEILGEARLLDVSLCEAMIRIVGFRNLLVHDYAKLDATRVVRILNEHLEDFMRFRAAVLSWA